MRGTTYYSCNAIAGIIAQAQSYDYKIITVREGVLGYGHMILLAPEDMRNYMMNVEIREQYVNEWSSAHRVRKFKKMSKRIQELIDKAEGGDDYAEV